MDSPVQHTTTCNDSADTASVPARFVHAARGIPDRVRVHDLPHSSTVTTTSPHLCLLLSLSSAALASQHAQGLSSLSNEAEAKIRHSHKYPVYQDSFLRQHGTHVFTSHMVVTVYGTNTFLSTRRCIHDQGCYKPNQKSGLLASVDIPNLAVSTRGLCTSYLHSP
jgi:hypothetical protein